MWRSASMRVWRNLGTLAMLLCATSVSSTCGDVVMNQPAHLDGFGHYSADRDSKDPCDDSYLKIRDLCEEGCSNSVPCDSDMSGCSTCCERKAVGSRNSCRLQRYASREWRAAGDATDLRPRRAIAISGGGMRSASFAIGVLSGLQRLDKMKEVDIISAVSGGAYALSWYYLQTYYSRDPSYRTKYDCDPLAADEILDPAGRHQKALEQHGAMMSLPRGAANAFTSFALFSPWNLFANGVFGSHSNTVPARRTYEEQIERTYHQTVPEVCSKRNKLPSVWPFSIGVRDEVGLGDLGYFARKEKLPYFVINATGYVDEDRHHLGNLLSNVDVEFAGDHIGSDGFDYVQWDSSLPTGKEPERSAKKFRETKVSRAVSISGAAIDGAAFVSGGSQKMLYSALNLDTGFYLGNYNKEITGRMTAIHDLMPFPIYFRHHYLKDRRGIKIYVSDGGHSENLGAFAAVRRMPLELIVIDGEQDYDPKTKRYKFDGYYILKSALKREMGVDLYVPTIENKLLKTNAFNTPNSCLHGWIRDFPLYEGKRISMAKIEVNYIKLSLYQGDLNRYPQTVQNYRRAHTDVACGGLLDRCPFPQESTSDQSFNKEQFEAYRDLGEWIVLNQYARGCQ